MGYNENTSYGRAIMDAVHNLNINPTGKVFIVGDSSTVNKDIVEQIFKSYEGFVRFYSTINDAVNYCTAAAGDTIIVLPGHSETLSSATALVLDISDVTIIGLGKGTDRPTITLDTATTTTIPVSAANITIKNIIFTANYADITSLFTLTTAKNFSLVDCYFKATATNMNFLAIVDTNTTANAADGLNIENCKWIEPDTATLYLVKGDADIDQLNIKNCYVNLGVNTSDLPALVNMATGKDVTNLNIESNKVIRLNDANPLLVVTNTTTANNGIIANNYVRHADTAGELLVTAGTVIGFFENKASAANDASGYILPAIDS